MDNVATDKYPTSLLSSINLVSFCLNNPPAFASLMNLMMNPVPQIAMEKWILLFLAFLNLKSFAQGQPDSWTGIDCGSNRSTATNGIRWQTDDDFIKTGTDYLIPGDSLQPLAILNTLRVFTEQNKNCYTLPTDSETRYFIRAFFFYANYDGLSSPPTFDLQIDGNKWATVVTSSTEYSYYEILYYSQSSSISVCLARTQNDQFPLISSLEAWSVPYTMYTGMSQDLAWLNSYRYNYGSDRIIWYPDDSYNRIWNPVSIAGYKNTTADPGTSLYYHSDESPPDSAVLDAIEAPNGTSLFLYFNPVQTMTAIYVEAYFTEMQSDLSGTRSFDMYADDKSLEVTVKPEYSTCTAAPHLVQTLSSNLTIELRPTATSPLPPIISAIEIYTASDPLVTTGTDQNDKDGLAALTGTFDQLKGWSGDPCLPADTVWQWLVCTQSDPPRVTAISLSGYNLNGALPDFSKMQALEDIDLSKNSLSGQIPEFLGQLPNLKNLNLSYNDFSGTLPSSLCGNTSVKYNVVGNRLNDPQCKPAPPPPSPPGSSKPSAAGPAVGTTIVVIIIIVAVVFWQIRRRRRQGNHQTTGTETWNGAGQESLMTSASTANLIRPQPTGDGEDDDCIPVSELEVKPDNNQSMIPEMDLDELEELIDQRANDGNHENTHNDQSMIPDMDLDELDETIKREEERDK